MKNSKSINVDLSDDQCHDEFDATQSYNNRQPTRKRKLTLED